MLSVVHSRFASAAAKNCFFDVAQPVLAEVDVVADKEGRRAERATRDRALGVGAQLVLDLVGLRRREKAARVEPGLDQRPAQHLGIVELLWLPPHLAIDLVDIALVYPETLRRDGAAHDRQ